MIRRICLRRRWKFTSWPVIVIFCAGIYLTYQYFNRQESVSGHAKLGDEVEDEDGDLLLQDKLVLDSMDPSEVLSYRKHRYLRYKNRPAPSGQGENGLGVKLSREEQIQADQLFEKEAFNIIASDMIALDRSVKDTRDPRCQKVIYPKSLPTASVIIIFHNEAWSPLLRTAHSVINRSPPEYLHEVILLDDYSDRPELGEKLQNYIRETWPDGVVKVVRTKERSGLIRARLAGAEAATGDVIIFLDSHCEANEMWLEPLLGRIAEKRSAVVCPFIDVIDAKSMGYAGVGGRSVGGFWWSLHFSWRPLPPREDARRKSSTDPIRLEPLLARIKEKRSSVLCPMIDAIDDKTMEYSGNGGVAVGGFTWSLHFTWRDVPPSEKKRRQFSHEPLRSPTMAGGLFAADRKYFFEIGGYDPGMDVWGGENLEISFRTWMCGGSLEFIPCSRVGHIFRASHPYTFPGNKDTHGLNSKRLADVWMDDYKRLFYMHRRDLREADAGDISDRLALREKLGCKSFRWYLDNVYPEKFIIDEDVLAYGMVRNKASGLCLDTMGKDEKSVFNIGLFFCQNGASANEVFSLSRSKELRREESCLDSKGREGGKVALMPCHSGKGNQEWTHDKKSGTIVHVTSSLCLDRSDVASGGEVLVNKCHGAESQIWDFEHYLEM